MDDIWSLLQKIIDEKCSDFDLLWQKRKRTIDTKFLLIFIFKLVLSKNQQGYGSVLGELWEHEYFYSLQDTPVSASSICEARQKLPSSVFTILNREIVETYRENGLALTWKGHRIFASDGCKINLPHQLIDYGYHAPNKYQHYPKGLMSTIYDLQNGFIHDCILTSNKSERECLFAHMDNLNQGDILVLDRGYFSYLLLHQAQSKGIHLICRLQFGSVNKEVKKFIDSDSVDKIITYEPSAAVKSEIKKQGFEIDNRAIQMRLIKYFINNETYVCATTLQDQYKYKHDDFAPIYHARWGIEELYKISKIFIELEDFHGQTENTVLQECYAHALLTNIARILELQANKNIPLSEPSNINPDDQLESTHWQDFLGQVGRWKVNFKNCLFVVGRNLIDLILFDLSEDRRFFDKIIRNIAKLRQKIRPGRHYPRQSRKPINKWKDARGGKVAYSA